MLDKQRTLKREQKAEQLKKEEMVRLNTEREKAKNLESVHHTA